MKKRLQVPVSFYSTDSPLMRAQLPDCKLHMELWDTAGAERFRSMCDPPNLQPTLCLKLSPPGLPSTSATPAALCCPPLRHLMRQLSRVESCALTVTFQVIVVDVTSPASLQVPCIKSSFASHNTPDPGRCRLGTRAEGAVLQVPCARSQPRYRPSRPHPAAMWCLRFPSTKQTSQLTSSL